MNAAYNAYETNYYINMKDVWLYIDYVNKRLKITGNNDIPAKEIQSVIEYAKNLRLGKVISYGRLESVGTYMKCGFTAEGCIKGFFNGEDAYCLVYYTEPERKIRSQVAKTELVLLESMLVKGKYNAKMDTGYIVRTAEEGDAPQMARLFEEVFETYPTPVFRPDYIKDIMKQHVLYKVAVEDGEIIGIASAEMDSKNKNAEITDCATSPEHRGKGILPNLILSLENELINKEFVTLYSLSRATNLGINKTLSKLGYEYNGRMVNNCHICGDFEDMNIWTKALNA